MKSFTPSLAKGYQFTERRDACQSPSNPPLVDLNIVIIWTIKKVARPKIVKGKMSHPVMRQSLSAVWSGSDLTIPQGLPDYIGLARGDRSIINMESCQSLSFTPRQCKTRLPCLDLLWHAFREMSAATAGKITARRQTAVAVITLRRAEETRRHKPFIRQGGPENFTTPAANKLLKLQNVQLESELCSLSGQP